MRTSLGAFLAVGVIYGSGMVDLPAAVRLGPISMLGLLAVAYAASAWTIWFVTPARGPGSTSSLPTWGLLAFLFWASVSLAWTDAPAIGAQNLTVLWGFLGLVLFSARYAELSPRYVSAVHAALRRATYVAALIYAVALFVDGEGVNFPFGARSFALFALLGIADQIAGWCCGERRSLIVAVLLTALVGLSLSRLALGIALLLFPLAQVSTRGLKKWVKAPAWVIIVLVSAYIAIQSSDALRSRFFEGDLALTVGPMRLNVSGRAAFGRLIYESYRDAIVLGKGAGSAGGVIQASFAEIEHPHSDYLRILHDYGVVGLSLWCAAMLVMSGAAWNAWRTADLRGDPQRRLHLAAFLMIVTLALTMTAENVITYAFVMLPAGVVVGLSLGSRARGKLVGPQWAEAESWSRGVLA